MQKLDMDGSSAASASKETGTGSSDTASTSYQQCMPFYAIFIQLISNLRRIYMDFTPNFTFPTF